MASPATLVPPWRVAVDTYEWDGAVWVLTVRHELYGGTRERALEVLAAHLRSDAFLRQCMHGGRFDGVVCRTTVQIERRP